MLVLSLLSNKESNWSTLVCLALLVSKLKFEGVFGVEVTGVAIISSESSSESDDDSSSGEEDDDDKENPTRKQHQRFPMKELVLQCFQALLLRMAQLYNADKIRIDLEKEEIKHDRESVFLIYALSRFIGYDVCRSIEQINEEMDLLYFLFLHHFLD